MKTVADIKEGDILVSNNSYIFKAVDPHFNEDEPDRPFIVYDKNGDCYFEEDLNLSLERSEKQLEIQDILTEAGFTIDWKQYIANNRSFVFFYGGDIAEIHRGNAIITLKANGDVIGSLQKTEEDGSITEVDSFRDKCNLGDRHDVFRYVKNNEDYNNATSWETEDNEYRLNLESNNWLEWFFDKRKADGSGDLELDVLESLPDDSDDIFEALSAIKWLAEVAKETEEAA